MAGFNAALAATGSKPFILDMFTSRAEYRLLLRADNADQRLTPLGEDIGAISSKRSQMFHVKLDRLALAMTQAKTLSETPNVLNKQGLKINTDGIRRSVLDLLAYPNITVKSLVHIWPKLTELDRDQIQHLETEAIYAGYIERQARDIAAFRRDEGLRLPDEFDYHAVGGISNEVKEKLIKAKPATLGQAARIEGVTPGALTALLAFVKKQSGKKAS